MINKGKAAFFDVDETLISGQTQMFLALTAFEARKIGIFKLLALLFFFVRYKLGLVSDIKEIMDASYAITEGWKVNEAEMLIKKCFDKYLRNKIFLEGKKLIENLKNRGFKIILVSNTLQQIVDLLVIELGADAGVGTTLLEKDGLLIGKIERLMYGVNKPKFIQQLFDKQFDLKESCAYSDNKSDIPLLEMVGYPTAVNPDKTLKKIAKVNDWPIIYFK